MEKCEVPCKSVSDAMEAITKVVREKVSVEIFMWVIAGIVVLSGVLSGVLLNSKMETINSKISSSGVLMNSKMETIQVQMAGITESVHDIRIEMKQMNGKRGRY